MLGVEPRLDGVSVRIACLEGERLAGRDEQLLLHEIDAGDELRDWMLDLDAGVQLEEGEAAVLAEDELGRARALVAQRAGERDGGFAHLAAQLGVDGGGGALLEHLLVAALDGAVALAEGDRVAVRVGEELDLDVARTLDVALEEHLVVAEAGERLALRGLDGFVELLRRADDPHAAPAPAGRGLDDQREPDLLGRAGLDHGDAGLGRDPLRLELVPGGTDDIRRRTHPGEPGSGDRLGQRGALGEEAVARMHGVRTGAAGRGDDLRRVEVGGDRFDLIGLAGVQRALVVGRVHGHRLHPEALGRAKDAGGDLAAVGDEQGPDGVGHGVSLRGRVRFLRRRRPDDRRRTCT